MQQESPPEESVMKSVDSSQAPLNQEEKEHMEFLENILSIPSWSELGVRNWEFGIDTSKLTKSELSGLLNLGAEKQGKGMQQDSVAADPQIGDMVDDAFLFAQLQQQRSMLSEGSISQLMERASSSLDMVGSQGSEPLLHRLEDVPIGLPVGSTLVGSAPPRPEAGQALSPSWRQPFIGGMPLEMFTNSNGGNVYGRGFRGGEELGQARDGTPGTMFNVYPSLPQPRAPVPPSQQVNTSAPGPQSGQAYRPQAASTQPQPVNPVAGGAPRPRVRARRGQATDPHSIAERLRRERIAERMKALQDLVPNANKTDKASMLDEIVDYVKFLQLQVKVLSMSRLGSAAAVPSLVADLPSEGANSLLASTLSRSTGISHDGLASAERQVARLMDEDMGSAMQYLQSKGLCLMPISLATASGKVPLSALQAIGSGDKQQYTDASVTVATDRSGSANNAATGKAKEAIMDSSSNKSNEGIKQPSSIKSPKSKTN
ncbi:uncharacterized protein LOC9638016 [Selaginella moellendorffii]|nr:uncharacterized protein LOC9638016 [Selaginella moellendorffii]XP_024523496.1 uncharacterized protein LOC9638016 [Selaginella moellendorffii]|eukprot:XP_002994179.2 uncharacterized protein LOC9638016 [Selaginella moellendorffii]